MAYGVRIKKSGTRRDYELLDSFGDDEADVLDFIESVLQLRKADAYKNDTTQQVLEVLDLRLVERQIEGTVRSGYWGTASDIRNLKKWTKLAYSKQVDDVDLQPYYFLFDLPEGKNMGYALLQRTGTEGIQGILAEVFEEPFGRDFPDFSLRMHQLAPDKLIRELERQEVSEIRFIRHSAPSDITALLTRKATKQSAGTMDLVIRLKERGLRVPAMRRLFEERQDKVLEFEGTRFAYESVKIKVELRGKERTIDLDDPGKLRAAFDINEEVEWARTGHPTFESISKAAKSLLADIKGQ